MRKIAGFFVQPQFAICYFLQLIYMYCAFLCIHNLSINVYMRRSNVMHYMYFPQSCIGYMWKLQKLACLGQDMNVVLNVILSCHPQTPPPYAYIKVPIQAQKIIKSCHPPLNPAPYRFHRPKILKDLLKKTQSNPRTDNKMLNLVKLCQLTHSIFVLYHVFKPRVLIFELRVLVLGKAAF